MPNNGILAEGVSGLEIDRIVARHLAGFTILIGSGHRIRIHDVEVTESGGFTPDRRNNAAGGVLLEDGTEDFDIRRCQFGGLRGNAITLRSVSKGNISENEFAVLARNAVQAATATGVAIANNRARQIGSPIEEVDGSALCFELEGFNGGEVTGNMCGDTLLGAIRVAGSNNRITDNHLLRLNTGLKDVAGIYLASGSKDNVVERNEVAGSGMSAHCVGAAPGVVAAANRIAKNDCSDEASVALLQPAIRR